MRLVDLLGKSTTAYRCYIKMAVAGIPCSYYWHKSKWFHGFGILVELADTEISALFLNL